MNDEYRDLEPVDLSQRSRSRRAKETVDYENEEFKEVVNSVFERLSGGSTFEKVVKVPSSITSYLDKYDGVGFKGLVSVVLETSGDLFYDAVAKNFLSAVYNMGIDAVGLPKSMKMAVPDYDHKETRLYRIVNELMSGYRDYLTYFFKDVQKFPSQLNSALDISRLYEAQKLKVSGIQNDLDKVRSKLSLENANLMRALNERSMRISDLTGLLSSLKNERARADEFRYYHFAVPRVYRMLKRQVKRALGFLKVRLQGVRRRLH
jgi:hypothetical protein